MGVHSIRLFPRDVDNHKAFDRWRFPMCFAYILLNKKKKYHYKRSFSFTIRWILGDFDYLCTQISVSWKEIEYFAKQISIYNYPNNILFALSTTDVSNEARYICVIASESWAEFCDFWPLSSSSA